MLYFYIFAFSSTWHMITCTTIRLPLSGKFVYVRQFCVARMPRVVHTVFVYGSGHNPIGFICKHTMGYVYILAVSCTRYYVYSTSVGLPLGCKFIDVRRITRIRHPRIIYTGRIYIEWYCPVSAIINQLSNKIHVLAFSSTWHMIFHCGHDFSRVPLIAKHIDVRRVSWIRYPTIIPFAIVQCMPAIIMLFRQVYCHGHVLAFGCSGHTIFHCGHDFS